MVIKTFKPSIHEIAPFIKEALAGGKEVRLTVTGFSMFPLLRGGTDDIILSKCDKVKKYDVVLFERDNGEYIFHRVIKKKDGILTIAGDNEIKKEYPVYEEKVIAKMTAFIRSGKTYKTTFFPYVLYSRLWLLIFPLRHIAVKLIHNTAVCMRKIKGVLCHKKDK